MADQQQQRPQVPPKTALSAAEAEEVAKLTRREGWLEFPADDVAMAWEAFPDGTATVLLDPKLLLLDFKRFIRMMSARGIDPLLNEAHFEYRNDNKSPTGMKGTAIIHQSADLKIAHRSGKLDGIEQKDGQDERGFYVQTLVFKKGCSHAFGFKAYHGEFSKNGGFTWNAMPYLMLAKCSRVGALRIAFPEELSGLMSEEEMTQEYREALPSETTKPLYNIGEKKPEPPIDPDPLGTMSMKDMEDQGNAEAAAKAAASSSTATATSGSGRSEPAAQAATAQAPAKAAEAVSENQEPVAAYKARLVVLVGRDSKYAKAGLTKEHVDQFLLSYFEVATKKDLPKEPEKFLKILDDLIIALAEREDALGQLKADPRKFAQYRRIGCRDAKLDAAAAPAGPSPYQQLKERFKWNDGLCYTAIKFMEHTKIESAADLDNDVLKFLRGMTEQQIETCLLVGYYDAKAMGEFILCHQQTKMPLGMLEIEIEKHAGKLSSFQCDPAKVVEGVALAIAAARKK